MSTLLNAAATPTVGTSRVNDGYTTFQATISGSGTDAVVEIQVSNDDIGYITAGTITLDSTTITDGFYAPEIKSWRHIRAELVSIAASSTVTCAIGQD